MKPISRSDFQRHLGGLSRADAIDFTAELWATQGWETTIRDDLIDVYDSDHNRRRRIRVIATRLRSRLLWDETQASVDVVVDTTDSTRLRKGVPKSGADYVGPDRLYEMALYSVDRETGNELFRRYFDRPIATPGDDGGGLGLFHDVLLPLDPRRLSANSAVVLLLVANLIVVLVGATTGFGGLTGSMTGQPTAADESLADLPPGLTATGIGNLSTLTETHRDAVHARAYNLTISHDGSRGQFLTAFRWIQATQTIHVGPDGDYAFQVDGTRAPMTIGGQRDRVSFAERRTHAGCSRYAPAQQAGRVTQCELLDTADQDTFAALSATYASRYLATSKSLVEAVTIDGERRFRVTAFGEPTHLSTDVSQYQAVAYVDPSGMITALTVSYRFPLDTGSVQFSFRYSDVE